ncbi:MAG: MerR family transcriptional regulator [Planctomycetota bacterium]|nr:MAG: MerR family transcriptional regulator [Planctomycetota bacterium]
MTPRPATPESPSATAEYLSIGDVAAATGFTPDTLRVWERRYGGPVPVRLPSGHRRYTREQVIWLRRIAEAIAMSHRPSKLLRLSTGELARLLESRVLDDARADEVRQLLALASEHRDAELRHRLEVALRHASVLTVLQTLVSPLLVAVGRAWASEEIGIRHEHGLVELLSDWLRQQRALREVRGHGSLVALATLEGERHGLGIQMAAVIAAERGNRVKLLGTDLPWQEVDRAARELRTQVVLIGISLSSGGIETDRMVGQLRAALPPEIALAIGGAGARSVRRGPRGVDCLDGLTGLDQWLAQRAPPQRPASLL